MTELLLCIVMLFCLSLLGVKLVAGAVKFFWGNIGSITIILGFIMMCLLMKTGG